MKLSTRAKYGLRICFLIALSKNPLSASQLVHRTDVGIKYIEQILAMLKSGNIVDAFRGKSGGYVLSRAPEEITVGDMLTALNDGFEPPECVGGECDDVYCPNRNVLSKLNDGIVDLFNSMTLADMISDVRATCYSEKKHG